MSAFRTVFEVLSCLIATITASLIAVAIAVVITASVQSGQMLRQYLDILASGNSFTDFRVQFICCITAAGLHIISLIPFEAGYEEERQHHIGHVNLISAVSPTLAAYYLLIEVQILSSISYSHHKKHYLCSSSQRIAVYAYTAHPLVSASSSNFTIG